MQINTDADTSDALSSQIDSRLFLCSSINFTMKQLVSWHGFVNLHVGVATFHKQVR